MLFDPSEAARAGMGRLLQLMTTESLDKQPAGSGHGWWVELSLILSSAF